MVATAGGGAVRITPAGGALDGAGPLNFTVAFMGISGVGPMRAVSLRGAVEALRFSRSGVTEGRPGFGGEGGVTEAGRVGDAAGGRGIEAGDSGDFRPEGNDGTGALSAEGGGGSGTFVSEAVEAAGGDLKAEGGGGGGRTSVDGIGVGGRAIGGAGGRTGFAPTAGDIGFVTTNGGGRTGAGAGEIEFGADGRAAPGGPGGRAGRLIRAVSFSTGTVGRLVVRGGSVMRTVSFFGSFRSAILLLCNSAISM